MQNGSAEFGDAPKPSAANAVLRVWPNDSDMTNDMTNDMTLWRTAAVRLRVGLEFGHINGIGLERRTAIATFEFVNRQVIELKREQRLELAVRFGPARGVH